MNTTKPLFFLTLLISLRGLAQDSLPPAYEIKVDRSLSTLNIQDITRPNIETKENQGTEFITQLPVTS